uniref:Uncharacterized protein n=1 Tax=Acrobeloides nanus TaxID=290746 RepID=A0A914EAL4_9BILA
MFVKSNDVVQKSISPFQWFDNVPLRFLIFDKRSKKFVSNPLSADTPMFVTHQLNAYEDAHGNLIADMITYNNADPYLKDLYRDYLLTRNQVDPNTVSRFTINTQKNATKNVVTSVIQDTLAVEFSNINFAYKTKPYTYAYMVKNLFTPGSSIIKINVNNINASGALEFQPGKTIVVHEPIYVAKPDSKQEDDGILLVRGIDVSLEQYGYFLCQLSATYGNDSNPEGQKLDHMIDAVGAVGSFHIQNGKVTFFSQYYPSVNYKIWDFYNRDMRKSTVAWDVSFSYQNTTSANLWNKIPKDDDALIISPNVDFWKFGEDIIAGTEKEWVGYKFDV